MIHPVARLLKLPGNRRLAIISALAAALVCGLWFLLPFWIALPQGLLENPDASPVFIDRHGQPLARLTLPGARHATPVTAESLPPDLIACTIAAEDKRFHSHGGIDLLATARAIRDLLTHRRIMSGASTITQQLVKISSKPGPRTPLTKVREALAARHLESRWSKSQILTAYLNRLDYGNRRIGAAEAASFYFQKPLADLSLAECALLAGLPQAPSRLNPLRHAQRALARRNLVLRRLAATQPHPAARINAALAEPLNLRPLADQNPTPWLAALHQPAVPSQKLIPTTLDRQIQESVASIAREERNRLKHRNLRHAAVLVIHNPSGEILAWVSSADWDDARGGQFNGALVPRSPGSTLKPFTYLLAMDQLARTPCSILADIPIPFRTPQGLDLPENYDRAYRGPVTLRSALACSLNVPALRELNMLGGPQPLHALLTRLGLTTLGQDPHHHGLGLTLGNAPVRLIELTNAYATLARRGRHLPATLFPPTESPLATELPFAQTSFFLLADILSDPAARAPAFPPGGPLDLPFRCAVKTGTSSNFRDNWCIGFTPEFTVGVWAGNFENQPMKGISGVDGAAPIFHRTMRLLHRSTPPTWFEQPPGIQTVGIDPRNGLLVTASHAGSKLLDLVPADRVPRPATAADYDPDGRALLDASFTAWFQSRHNQRKHELTLTSANAPEPLKILSPDDGVTLLLDPEIPSGSERLRPVTNLPGTARWSSPSLRIEQSSPEPVIILSPGTHTLTATDPRTGLTQHITLHVKSL